MPERQYLNWFRPNGNLATQQKLCCANVVCVSAEKDCYYLECNNCTTKLVGSTDNLLCPSCKVQVGEPVPRYLLRLRVEDQTGSAFFVAMDTKVQKMVQVPASDAVAKGKVKGMATAKAAFKPLLGVFHDYLIMLTLYNLKTLETTSFTVAKLPSIPQADRTCVYAYYGG
ncbi:hypothetical protein MKX01_040924 [Papaver californicum]|nr:hypothetical protein MKX01_040924 [Papaver californicum]